MNRPSCRNVTTRRRGAVAVLTAAVIVVLLLCATLAVDLGHIHAVAAEMQHTADGASLAGASALREEVEGDANGRALDIIDRMQQTQGFASLEDQTIEVGIWNSVTKEFSTLAEAGADRAFAVRVVSRRSETPYFFAGLMGFQSADVYREAVAVGSGPCGGIWGLEGIKAGSVTTDSYDSTVDAYNPLTAKENGDLCSGREITIGGSIDLNGDAMSGFGYEVTVNGASYHMTGLTTSNWLNAPVPAVEVGDFEIVNDNANIGLTDGGKSPWKGSGWNLDIQANDRLTIPAGTYYLDSVKLNGGATVNLTGATKLYVLGSIDATGGSFVTESQNPADLEIISLGSDVKISGGTGFYGSLLAPYAAVVLTGGDGGFFGGVVGRTVDLKGDFIIHVDESLPINNLFTPPQPMLVR